MSRRQVEVAGTIVELHDTDTQFNDRTLNPFFERISGRIDYIGQMHADAQREALKREQEHEQEYIKKYKFYKEEGKSDKTAEMYAKGDPVVQDCKSKHIEARHAKDTIWAHLQSLNAAREDAHNLGHTLRAEMKHLNMDIYQPQGNMDDRVNEI